MSMLVCSEILLAITCVSDNLLACDSRCALDSMGELNCLSDRTIDISQALFYVIISSSYWRRYTFPFLAFQKSLRKSVVVGLKSVEGRGMQGLGSRRCRAGLHTAVHDPKLSPTPALAPYPQA